MATHPFRTSLRRARVVFGPILANWRANPKGFPFNRMHVVVPQLGDEDALLLFYTCSQMQGGIDSSTAIRALRKMRAQYPHLFDPGYIVNRLQVRLIRTSKLKRQRTKEGVKSRFVEDEVIEAPELTQALVEFGLGFRRDEVTRNWLINSWRLFVRYSGDPHRLIEGVRSYDQACRRLLNDASKPEDEHGFLGFGYKMVSMLLYFYMYAGILPVFEFPPPIDIHWLRIIVATRIVYWSDGERGQARYDGGGTKPRNYYQPEILAALRRLLVRYLRSTGTSPLEFCDAIWLHARELCWENPGNWFSQQGSYDARFTVIERNVPKQASHSELPLFSNGAAPPHVPADQMVWDDRRVKAFARSCLRCSVHQLCEHNVPSMPYQRHGAIVVMGRREEPPNAALLRSLIGAEASDPSPVPVTQSALFPDDP